MDSMRTCARRGTAPVLWTSALLALLSACSGGGGGGSNLFVLNSSDDAVAQNATIVTGGRWLVYFADETATGMDLNSDGDMADSIATVIDMFGFTKTSLDVAALAAEVVGNEIYLAVSEADDGMTWNPDADMVDRVLLHWSQTAGMLTFVEELDPTAGTSFVASGTRLYYPADPAVAAPANGESTLHYVDAAMPTVAMTVMHTDAANPLQPLILGEDEGLLFIAQDESVEGRDLNADGDQADGTVLALLDATDPAAMIQNTSLAVSPASPFRALGTGANDWTVAFLVNEAGQGGASLNDKDDFPLTWRPTSCVSALGDEDTADEVLHFLEFAAWSANPGMSPPVNTGLAGSGTVAVVPGFVATISPESAQDNCDLNGDLDMADNIVEYVGTGAGDVPQTNVNFLVAVDTATPGGTFGLSSQNDIFTIAVDEAAQDDDLNADGDMADRLFAWHDPNQPGMGGWRFDHDAGAPMVFVGVDWMAPRSDNAQTLVALQEAVFSPGMSINSTDNDDLDSVPTFTRENFSGGMISDLDFPGVAVAVNSGAPGPGMVVAANQIFYRVNEMEDNNDWNNDGDMNDDVLLRSSLFNGSTVAMGTLNSVVAGSAITTDGVNGAGFVADEAQAAQDFNGDGDMTDFVLRWFRIL